MSIQKSVSLSNHYAHDVMTNDVAHHEVNSLDIGIAL